MIEARKEQDKAGEGEMNKRGNTGEKRKGNSGTIM